MKTVKVLTLFCWLQSSFAFAEMTYIYNAPESDLDNRYQYQWAVLQSALDITTKEYGDYKMIAAKTMTERRQVREMISASGSITVMFLDSNPEFEGKLIPVRIPVDKSLVGYRVLLIRKEDKNKFEKVQTLDQLRAFSYGQGQDWIDVKILRANQFKVVTGSNYEGLFVMLSHGRFDVFPRGANEILGEYEAHKEKLPNLYIEKNIILYYPLPMYFWFSKTTQGKKLAERTEEGMWTMIQKGTLDKLFNRYHAESIKKLELNKRKVFRIDNPLLVPETPLDDKKLWFDLNPKR